MANPNLIQQAMESRKETTHKVPASLFVALAIIVFSVMVYFAFFLVGMLFDSRAEAVEDNIQEAEIELRRLENEAAEARSFVERLKNLESLASDHVFWSGILNDIAGHTDKRVQYISLRGDIKENSVVLQARASDLAAVERNLVGLRTSDRVREVSTSNVVYNIDPRTQIVNVTFDVVVDLQPGVLQKIPEAVELKSANATGGTNE